MRFRCIFAAFQRLPAARARNARGTRRGSTRLAAARTHLPRSSRSWCSRPSPRPRLQRETKGSARQQPAPRHGTARPERRPVTAAGTQREARRGRAGREDEGSPRRAEGGARPLSSPLPRPRAHLRSRRVPVPPRRAALRAGPRFLRLARGGRCAFEMAARRRHRPPPMARLRDDSKRPISARRLRGAKASPKGGFCRSGEAARPGASNAPCAQRPLGSRGRRAGGRFYPSAASGARRRPQPGAGGAGGSPGGSKAG